MSYSDDLDWLARNVHEWPFGIQSYVYVITEDDGSKIWGGNVHYCAKRHQKVGKEDWLARRAELQAKAEPHPFTGLDEAIRKVLSVMRTEPEAFTPKELSEMKGMCDAELAKLDTLEKRPDMNKNQEEIDTSAESVQEAAKSMRDWHERGELPPVGTKCEYRLSTASTWYPCEIKYVIHDDGVVMMREDGFEQFCSINGKLQPVSFRPIRTERGEAIEAMKAHCPYPGSWETTYRLFAESLYDAGYRAGGSE